MQTLFNLIVDIIIFFIKLPFRIIRWLLNLPFIKGKIGEHKISGFLNRLIKNDGFVINDLTISNETSSKTHQLDHIIISSKGVFAIETKNYSGRIYGDDSQKDWTQVLNYGKVKNKFYSPVKQNETHIYSLKEKFEDRDIYIHNVVIFLGADIDYVNSDCVFTPREFKHYYKKLSSNIIDDDSIVKIYNILVESKENIKNKEHVKNIKIMQSKIENNICPRCGAPLVERQGKYGAFYGCSEYPKCKFIKK